MDGRYDKDLECVWLIHAPVNKLIQLTFNTFELEAASSSQNCHYDYVKVRLSLFARKKHSSPLE